MRLRPLALSAAGLLTAAGSVAVLLPSAGAATAGCRVDYRVANQWPGGYQGDVTITNLGDPVPSWSLGFDLAAGQSVTQGWNGTWSQTGAHVTATDAGWNGSLATGASVSLGFIGTWSGANPVPAAFTVNGARCAGGPSTPPPAGPTVTPPATPPTSPPDPPTSPPVTPPSPPTTPPTTPPGTPTTPPGDAAAPPVHVSGNRLVTAAGATVRLLGVNRSGGEFACIQGRGFWDGPMDQASVTAMRAWKVRAVRVPLNEECWLGTADVPAAFGGAAYQAQVESYVRLLIANGITPIVEMHWNYGTYTGPSSACADVTATCQKPMPDAHYAPAFWTGVASAFQGDDAVIFDLFNEPYPERATGDATAGWRCWRDGGACPGIPYSVAGFQRLVDTVRATGATNVILIGGLAYANDLSQWLTWKPVDPRGNLAAFAHVYNFNACAAASCWDAQLAPVAASVPLTLSEIGENDCAHGFVDTLMSWADAHAVGYLGWTWNTWDCRSGPSLIADHSGTPTAYGRGLQDRLATVSS